MKNIFIVAAFAAFAIAAAAEIRGEVIKVYDGDTITERDSLDGGKFRIRLVGTGDRWGSCISRMAEMSTPNC